MKDYLLKYVVLAFPDLNKPFTLYTDASDAGIGAMLFQNLHQMEAEQA